MMCGWVDAAAAGRTIPVSPAQEGKDTWPQEATWADLA